MLVKGAAHWISVRVLGNSSISGLRETPGREPLGPTLSGWQPYVGDTPGDDGAALHPCHFECVGGSAGVGQTQLARCRGSSLGRSRTYGKPYDLYTALQHAPQPVTTAQLIAEAERNGAAPRVLHTLRRLPERSWAVAADAVAAATSGWDPVGRSAAHRGR